MDARIKREKRRKQSPIFSQTGYVGEGGKGILTILISLKFKVAEHFGSIITCLLELVFPFWPSTDTENSYYFVEVDTCWLSQIKFINVDNLQHMDLLFCSIFFRYHVAQSALKISCHCVFYWKTFLFDAHSDSSLDVALILENGKLLFIYQS